MPSYAVCPPEYIPACLNICQPEWISACLTDCLPATWISACLTNIYLPTLLKLRTLNSEHIIGCCKTKLSMERNMFLVCGPGKYICISVVFRYLLNFPKVFRRFPEVSGSFSVKYHSYQENIILYHCFLLSLIKFNQNSYLGHMTMQIIKKKLNGGKGRGSNRWKFPRFPMEIPEISWKFPELSLL